MSSDVQSISWRKSESPTFDDSYRYLQMCSKNIESLCVDGQGQIKDHKNAWMKS